MHACKTKNIIVKIFRDYKKVHESKCKNTQLSFTSFNFCEWEWAFYLDLDADTDRGLDLVLTDSLLPSISVLLKQIRSMFQKDNLNAKERFLNDMKGCGLSFDHCTQCEVLY